MLIKRNLILKLILCVVIGIGLSVLFIMLLTGY